MDQVTKIDDLTVKVTTKTPWKAFPAYLYLEGRAGIMAPAQMNNTATCATNMIGTGPFKLNSPSDWKVNESLKVVKNPDYWRKDAKGNALPCASSITFVPIPDSPTRDTQLIGGQLDMMHTSSSQSIDKLSTTSGIDVLREKPGNRETRIYQINAQKPPFNNPEAREALAMQMIFQDPISSLNPRRRVREIVGEGLEIWSIGNKESREAKVAEVLDAVGIDPRNGERRPHEFSGGQCQRISIARAVVTEPKLIICDEPVSALDVSVQAQILNLLQDMKQRYGLTLIFIAHDLAVVKNVSDRVMVMYLGKVCEVAPPDEIGRAHV